jgi:hypothetical protein
MIPLGYFVRIVNLTGRNVDRVKANQDARGQGQEAETDASQPLGPRQARLYM